MKRPTATERTLTRAHVALLALALLAACDRPPERAAQHEHDEHHERGEHHDEHGHDEPARAEPAKARSAAAARSTPEPEGAERSAAGMLRVAPEMLRDLRITTAAAESRPAGERVTALGELHVNEEAYAEIGSPVAARVTEVLVQPGDRVGAGDVLVRLESAEVGRARAALVSAEARFELARRTFERREGLARDQIIAGRELESARAELAEAEAERRSAELALAALGAERGKGASLSLTSPIAGTLIERRTLRGRVVQDAEPLFVVGDLSVLWLVVHAFERDAVRLSTGGSARIGFAALPGQSFDGTVTRIGSRVDPSSRTVDVRIEVPNPGGVLKPGMSATASIAIGDGSAEVVAVPTAALQRLYDGWCVFMPREQAGAFEVRRVGRGRDLGGEVEILSGLSPGEPVVVDGAFLLKAEADKQRGGGGHDHHH